jgi:hypothetical protein
MRNIPSNGGAVGTKIGNSVLHPFTHLSASTYNFVSMVGANATLNAATDYFVVLAVSNPNDTLRLRTDNVTTGTRSKSYVEGGNWVPRTRNHRIQAIVTTTTPATIVDGCDAIPMEYALSKNFPNPFNPSTTINFSIPRSERVKLAVFDLLGREIAILVDELKDAGNYQVVWNGTNGAGIPASSGVYFFRLETPNFAATERMMLLK